LKQTGEVVFLLPFLDERRREERKRECGYAFLRFEHECSAAMSYWRRGVGCEPASARLALKIFLNESARLAKELKGTKREEDLSRRLIVARHQTSKISNRLDQIEQLPIANSAGAAPIMFDLGRRLDLVGKKIEQILPTELPLYQEDVLILLADNTGSA